MTKRRFAAVCVLLATATVALAACNKGNTSGTGSSGATASPDAATVAASSDVATTEKSADNAQTQPAPERDKITIAIPQDLDALDPHKAAAAGTREVLFNVFEGLVKPDVNGDLIPALASEWTISDDAIVYTFTIREGVKFHDGTEVTAEDVVYSVNRCLDDATASPYQSGLKSLESIAVNDEGKVEITLSAPDSEFLTQLTCPVIPEAAGDPEKNPVGTGPYKYVSRAPRQNLILEAFEEYWDAEHKAAIRNVECKIEADANTIAMGLESGAIDMFCRLTPEQMDALQGVETLEITEGPMNLVVAVYLNNAVAPFDDVRVRQALSLALDKQEIMDFMFDGAGSPIASSMFPAFGKYYDDSLNDLYPTDTAKAKELLAEAGLADGFTFSIQVPSNYQQYVDMSEIIREQFAKIGVTMDIQLIEWSSWLEDVYGGRDFEATIVGVDASTLAASALLSRFRSDASNNFVNFSSEAYDRVFAEAKAAIDDEEKTAKYRECVKILAEEAANVYIMDMPSYTALNKDFTGYAFYPLYVQDFAKLRTR